MWEFIDKITRDQIIIRKYLPRFPIFIITLNMMITGLNSRMRFCHYIFSTIAFLIFASNVDLCLENRSTNILFRYHVKLITLISFRILKKILDSDRISWSIDAYQIFGSSNKNSGASLSTKEQMSYFNRQLLKDTELKLETIILRDFIWSLLCETHVRNKNLYSQHERDMQLLRCDNEIFLLLFGNFALC